MNTGWKLVVTTALYLVTFVIVVWLILWAGVSVTETTNTRQAQNCAVVARLAPAERQGTSLNEVC